MPDKVTTSPETEIGSQELTEEYIQLHAYQLFEKRGRVHGHDVEDWLEAEAQIFGKKHPSVRNENEEKKQTRGTNKSAATAA